jgi:hypothetical protein
VKELRETSSITSHAFAGTTFWGEKLRGHHFWKYFEEKQDGWRAFDRGAG